MTCAIVIGSGPSLTTFTSIIPGSGRVTRCTLSVSIGGTCAVPQPGIGLHDDRDHRGQQEQRHEDQHRSGQVAEVERLVGFSGSAGRWVQGGISHRWRPFSACMGFADYVAS